MPGRGTVIPVLTALLAAALLTPIALAAKPVIERIDIDEGGPDPFLTAECGFAVDVHFAGQIIARTFSKIAALAAMRVGYAVSTPEIIKQLRVYASNSVNVLAKHGAVASLKDTAGQAEVKAKIIGLRNKTTRELEAQVEVARQHVGDGALAVVGI